MFLASWLSVVSSSVHEYIFPFLPFKSNLSGCLDVSAEERLKCLLATPAENIVSPTGTRVIDPVLRTWTPVLDNECLTDTVANLMQQGKFHKGVDVLAGFTHDEGFLVAKFMASGFNTSGSNLGQFRLEFSCYSINI